MNTSLFHRQILIALATLRASRGRRNSRHDECWFNKNMGKQNISVLKQTLYLFSLFFVELILIKYHLKCWDKEERELMKKTIICLIV